MKSILSKQSGEACETDFLHERIQAHHSAVQAALVRRLRTVHEAEDAMQDAILRALETWPKNGVPDNIRAWLITTGMNSFRDRYRKESRLQAFPDNQAEPGSPNLKIEDGGPDDDVLRLIYMCCHPAIAIENQLALTLKMVMGFSLTEIASALLVPGKTLEKRISRAKAKITAAGINFQLPSKNRLQSRIAPVQQVLYLIFNEGYYGSSGELINRGLCRQAISLTRALCRSYHEPENFGLLALMLFHDARVAARIDSNQELVTLDKQDRSLWSKAQIREADVLLQKALRQRQSGFYQLQAAIAGLHSQAPSAAETDWQQIVGLYQHLLRVRSDAVIALNYSVALMFAGEVSQASRIIENLESELTSYSPFYAARAKLEELLEQPAAMKKSLQKAASLSGSAQEERHYRIKLSSLEV